MPALALIVLAFVAADADAGEWRLDENADGIKVYTRSVEGSRYREFKGVVHLHTSLASAVGVLDNPDSCAEWLHLCERSRVLEKRSWAERFIYQVSDMPFPASHRDAIFKATIYQEPNDDIHIELSSRPDFIPETRYVRIHESRGEYLLQKVDEDTIRLTWTMHIDPAGSLPAFLVNRLLTDIPFKSLQDFREVVEQDKYQVLEFEYDETGQAVGLLHKRW